MQSPSPCRITGTSERYWEDLRRGHELNVCKKSLDVKNLALSLEFRNQIAFKHFFLFYDITF